MPTRRIFELIIITGVLITPALGTVKLWARKMQSTHPDGSLVNTITKPLVVVL